MNECMLLPHAAAHKVRPERAGVGLPMPPKVRVKVRQVPPSPLHIDGSQINTGKSME